MQRVLPSAPGPSMIEEGVRARISDAAERMEKRIGSVVFVVPGLPPPDLSTIVTEAGAAKSSPA